MKEETRGKVTEKVAKKSEPDPTQIPYLVNSSLFSNVPQVPRRILHEDKAVPVLDPLVDDTSLYDVQVKRSRQGTVSGPGQVAKLGE